ncbi:MAG TPA: hypothetical protein VHN15_00945 [Thermoanaerobaculia bacterium]|nr:hypothetical protein [Thermoanaerobaculia bacterium]
MKKNRKKLSLKAETLHELTGGTQSYSGTPSCLCETLECPTHHICTVLNTCTCA